MGERRTKRSAHLFRGGLALALVAAALWFAAAHSFEAKHAVPSARRLPSPELPVAAATRSTVDQVRAAGAAAPGRVRRTSGHEVPRSQGVQRMPGELSAQRFEFLQRTAALRAQEQERYQAADSRFEKESRDEAWAAAREAEVRGRLERAGFTEHVVEVRCKATLCRYELALVDARNQDWMAAPSLRQALPEGVVAQVVRVGSERRLRVYDAAEDAPRE